MVETFSDGTSALNCQDNFNDPRDAFPADRNAAGINQVGEVINKVGEADTIAKLLNHESKTAIMSNTEEEKKPNEIKPK